MILASQRLGDPDAPHLVVFLHGIFGSGTNWRSFARQLLGVLPEWQVLLLDLRNHGDSIRATGPNTLSVCADDIAETFAAHKLTPTALCGHSFGGKVALTYAEMYASGVATPMQQTLRSVHVLDSPPGPSLEAPSTVQVQQVLSSIDRLPQPSPSRDAAVATLEGYGLSPIVARWIATNLMPASDGYRWRFYIPGLREMLADFWVTDRWPVVLNPPVLVHVVRAEKSQVWTAADLDQLQRITHHPRVRVDILPNADHWVHVDNPRGLVQLLSVALQHDSLNHPGPWPR